MLTPEEFKNIGRYLTENGKGKKVYEKACERIRKYSQDGSLYFICPFSNENKRCDIYFIRPSVCKNFHCAPDRNKVDKSVYDYETTKIIGNFFTKIYYEIAGKVRGL
jgi:Fe-S-cluster containining protein